MSASTPGQVDEEGVRVDRMIAETRKLLEETRKFVAESHKLDAEALKLHADRRKTERDRGLAPFAMLIAAMGAGAAIFAAALATIKAFGH